MEPLALIVAMNQDGVIGNAGGLPWRIPEDLRHFKRTTLGHTLIMGRKTFDSIGRPLPERRSIVISRNPELSISGCETATSFDDALKLARKTDACPFVIGGASIYEAALPQVTRMHITEVDRDVEGDTFFPTFERNDFQEIERRNGETAGVQFVILARRT